MYYYVVLNNVSDGGGGGGGINLSKRRRAGTAGVHHEIGLGDNVFRRPSSKRLLFIMFFDICWVFISWFVHNLADLLYV